MPHKPRSLAIIAVTAVLLWLLWAAFVSYAKRRTARPEADSPPRSLAQLEEENRRLREQLKLVHVGDQELWFYVSCYQVAHRIENTTRCIERAEAAGSDHHMPYLNGQLEEHVIQGVWLLEQYRQHGGRRYGILVWMPEGPGSVLVDALTSEYANLIFQDKSKGRDFGKHIPRLAQL